MENVISDLKLKNEVRGRKSWRALKIEEQRLERYELEDLWARYRLKTRSLESRFPHENNRTLAENEFCRKVRLHTDLEIYPGLWVGPWQVDAYLPEINALVEIDGGSHNSEGKMYKGDQKFRQLANLHGNWPLRFQNHVVYSNFVWIKSILDGLPRLNNREKELQIKRLLLTTLESD